MFSLQWDRPMEWSQGWKSESEIRSVVSDSLQPHGLYSPWNSPGQNTGMGSLSLLQGIFPTQGSSPGLPHCRWIFYQLSHKGDPRILEWVAYPFSTRSSWPRNWTRVSCIAGGFFTNWGTREAQRAERLPTYFPFRGSKGLWNSPGQILWSHKLCLLYETNGENSRVDNPRQDTWVQCQPWMVTEKRV